MVWLMRKCRECGKYTLEKNKCPYCGAKVSIPHPAKFSPDDKYAKYKGLMRSLRNERDNNNREEKG